MQVFKFGQHSINTNSKDAKILNFFAHVCYSYMMCIPHLLNYLCPQLVATIP